MQCQPARGLLDGCWWLRFSQSTSLPCREDAVIRSVYDMMPTKRVKAELLDIVFNHLCELVAEQDALDDTQPPSEQLYPTAGNDMQPLPASAEVEELEGPPSSEQMLLEHRQHLSSLHETTQHVTAVVCTAAAAQQAAPLATEQPAAARVEVLVAPPLPAAVAAASTATPAAAATQAGCPGPSAPGAASPAVTAAASGAATLTAAGPQNTAADTATYMQHDEGTPDRAYEPSPSAAASPQRYSESAAASPGPSTTSPGGKAKPQRIRLLDYLVTDMEQHLARSIPELQGQPPPREVVEEMLTAERLRQLPHVYIYLNNKCRGLRVCCWPPGNWQCRRHLCAESCCASTKHHNCGDVVPQCMFC